MTIDLILEFLNTYGPWALGWLLWLFERVVALRRDEAYRNALINNTTAMNSLADRITHLIEAVKFTRG